MKSLRDEIRLAAGDMDGFNFIQAFGLDFICTADFILATARISLYNTLELITVAENKAADRFKRMIRNGVLVGTDAEG